MTAIIENFEVNAGDDLMLRFTVAAPTGATLEGATIKWWASRDHFGEPARDNASGELLAPVIQKQTGAGIVIEDMAERIFTVTIDKTDTEGLSGRFYHEAEVTDSDGKKSTVTKGVMTIVRTLIPSVV